MASVIDIERHRAFRAAWNSLTPQQRRVVTLRCEGSTNAEIGAQICIEGQTVKNTITGALRKLHPVARGAKAGNRGAMETVCWRIGYESAIRDIQRTIAARKAG